MTILVMDTGVLVAGLFWRHEAHQCMQAWQHDVFQLAVTDAIFEEYRRVAFRVKERERLPGDPEPMLRLIREHALCVMPEPLASPVCRDPKDDKFIEAALAAKARYLLARDTDLTDLQKPFGVEIVTPRQFLSRLPRQIRRELGGGLPRGLGPRGSEPGGGQATASTRAQRTSSSRSGSRSASGTAVTAIVSPSALKTSMGQHPPSLRVADGPPRPAAP